MLDRVKADVNTDLNTRADHPPTAILSLRGIGKTFNRAPILSGLDLEAYDGEFLSLLGPSGCGKTTTLRIIAGFEQADAGILMLGGEDITDRPPNTRDVSTVFQDYSLFPHLSVADNVAFGLVERRMPKDAIRARVSEMLDMVRLAGFEVRRPAQLSGGQKQRVALARALAVRPRVLLLDEPLGALDLKLRKDMQIELRAFQKRLGTTFIFVTHDQEEAMTMADRVVVMKDGRIQQIGSPRDIYERPANRFVADFIGETTFLNARCEAAEAAGPSTLVEVLGQRLHLAQHQAGLAPGMACVLSVRPEKLRLLKPGEAAGLSFEAIVETVIFRGAALECLLRLPDGAALKLTTPDVRADAAPGRRLRVGCSPADVVLLP